MSEHETLAKIRAAAQAATPRRARAADIAAHIREERGYRWVGLYDVTATEVAILAWSGSGPPAHPRFPRSHGLTGRAVANAEAVFVQDVTADVDYLEAFGDTRAEAIVPVIMAGAVVGTIDVESSEPSVFTETDRAFLERCRDEALPVWA